MSHAIEVSGLTKHFGKIVAVDDLSFTVDEGRVVGFLGPNGAGKTTTLRMLLGLVNPTAGTATVMEGNSCTSTIRFTRSARCSTAGCCTPAAPGGTISARSPGAAGVTDQRASRNCSSWWRSRTPGIAARAGTRSACASGSGSPARCSEIRGS